MKSLKFKIGSRFPQLYDRLMTNLQNKFFDKIEDPSVLKLVNVEEMKYVCEERMCGNENNVIYGTRE